jgi:hypothetical protein
VGIIGGGAGLSYAESSVEVNGGEYRLLWL